jgi:hypothetical protein
MSDPTFIAASQMVAAMGPVTKEELDRLKGERDKPIRTLDLTIGGTVEQTVHSDEHAQRTARESYIANRLERMRGRAENDFSKASVRGRAKDDFERSR